MIQTSTAYIVAILLLQSSIEQLYSLYNSTESFDVFMENSISVEIYNIFCIFLHEYTAYSIQFYRNSHDFYVSIFRRSQTIRQNNVICLGKADANQRYVANCCTAL